MTRQQFLGIDFGTSTTLIAESLPAGRPSVVPVGRAESWMPSLAAVDGTSLVVAEDALAHAPSSIIRSVKSCITERRDVARSADGSVAHTADDVIASVLRELAERARADRLPISEPGVTRLGCPAMWDAEQRQRLLRLAEDAGFLVGPTTLIDEPIAAGLSWIGVRTQARDYFDAERILVFDMGGGTLDVAVMDVTTGPGQDPQIYVLASDGLNSAGDVLDAAIAADLEADLRGRGIDLDALTDPDLARAYLTRAATETKVDLSSERQTEVHIGYTAADLPPLTYTREQLEDAIRPQLERAWSLVISTLRASHLTDTRSAPTSVLRAATETELTAKVQHVLLAGGMSQIPAVEKFLALKMPGARTHTFPGNNGSQEAIVAGLAENTSYEELNMHRPAFDFVLEMDGGAHSGPTRLPLYRAHTKLYDWWEAMSRERLLYEWPQGATAVNSDAARSLPRSGVGRLAVYAMDGTAVELRHDTTYVGGLQINFGRHPIRLTISPHGDVRVTDGRGVVQSFRVDRWPALSSGLARLALRVKDAEWVPMDRHPWDTK